MIFLTKDEPIACDIDGVLADFDECFRRAAFDTLGINLHHIRCAPTWDLCVAYGLTKEQEKRIWNEPFLRLHMAVAPMLPKAKEIVGLLPAGSFYITARGSDPIKPHAVEFRKLTLEWMAIREFPDFPIIFSNDKVEFCIRHNIKHAIDDAPHHAEDYANAGIEVLMPVTDYNTHIESELITRLEG